MAIRVFLTMLLCGWAANCDGGLVISEIMNNPSSATGDGTTTNSDEWFELFNSGGTSVDLTNIKFDDDADASDGATLSGTLQSGRYAIVANRSQAIWQGLYGNLPSNALFVQLASPWNVLNNSGGDTLSLYSSLSGSNFFTLSYGASSNGASLQFTGTSVTTIAPYSFAAGAWQNATSSPGGSSGDFHSGGVGSLRAAPEPASASLLLLAATGLGEVLRRRYRLKGAALERASLTAS